MKKILWGNVAVAAILAAAPAIAADMKPTYKAAPLPVASAFSWTGFYFGGQVGMSTSAMDAGPFDYTDTFDFGKGDATQTLAGFHAGYNYQVSNIVLGVEGDLNAKFGEGYFAPGMAAFVPGWVFW